MRGRSTKEELSPSLNLIDVSDGIKPSSYLSLGERHSIDIDGEVVDEALVCISVNGVELATFMCSPINLEEMAVGFLYNESLIDGHGDVRTVHLSKNNTCVDVWLNDESVKLPDRPIITAGCGGGLTFDDLSQRHEPLQSNTKVAASRLAQLMREMHLGASLYHRARGIHTAAVADNSGLKFQVEDVGRHNCLDKIAGAALLSDFDTKNCILLTSGRISSEMINKARRLGTPVVCSRTSPTSLSVSLAEEWNMTIVAYLRKRRMRIYSGRDRIIQD